MSDAWISEISDRYIELYEGITGEKFNRTQSDDILTRVENNILGWLKTI
jgi:phosphoribosylaminoimidazole-succinocarboxamide synthase